MKNKVTVKNVNCNGKTRHKVEEMKKENRKAELLPLNDFTNQAHMLWEAEERRRCKIACNKLEMSPTDQSWALWRLRASQQDYSINKMEN